MEENNEIEEIRLKDLPKSYREIKYKGIHKRYDVSEDFLSQIPEEYYENLVSIVKNNAQTNTGEEVVKFMNERFIFKQLNLMIQPTDKREIFYIVRRALGGIFDITGSNTVIARKIDNMLKEYCKKLKKILKVSYWGYVFDYLEIVPKETVIVFDTHMKTTMLSSENLEDFIKTPFFLIICEKKETLRATMEEMINRGYNHGYYGVALGGTSTTINIKLLIELSKVRNFYAFIMHDLDLDGLKIFFNMKKWFPCESIGINPEMLEFCKIEFEDGYEDYNPGNKDKTIKHLYDVIEKYPEEKKIYEKWIAMCENKRFELNSLTSIRLKEDYTRNKARDFVDYLLTKIEELERKWNLIRLKNIEYWVPTYYNLIISKPKIINDIEDDIEEKIDTIKTKLDDIIQTISEKQEEIKEKAFEPLITYLESKNLHDDLDWEELVKDDVEKITNSNQLIFNLFKKYGKKTRKLITVKLKKYKGEKVVKLAEKIINGKSEELKVIIRNLNTIFKKIKGRQEKVCNRLIKKTPKYKEISNELIENRDNYCSVNLQENLEELKEILEEKIENLSLEE